MRDIPTNVIQCDMAMEANPQRIFHIFRQKKLLKQWIIS